MSLLATETQNKVAAVRQALASIERHLDPLLAKNPSEITRKLGALEQAELQVGLAYTIASLYFSHLLTQGVDPAEHPIKQELDRIQLYFKKLRTLKEEIDTKETQRDRKRLDAQQAQRMLEQYASAAEASMQRRQAASTSSSSPAPVPTPATAPAEPASAPETTDSAPAPAEAFLSDVDEPAATESAVAETPATSNAAVADTNPSPKKKRKVIAKSSPKAAAKAAAAPGDEPESQANLVPVEPAGDEARSIAASLVAKGKAAAARKKIKGKATAAKAEPKASSAAA